MSESIIMNKHIQPSEKNLELMQTIRMINGYSANLNKNEYERVMNCMYDIDIKHLYHITNTDFSKQFTPLEI